MNVYQTQVEAKIAEMFESQIDSMGYELVRVKFMPLGHRKILQVMLDRKDGEPLTIEDCEKVSRHMSVVLDVEDIISSEYSLEVSSPGFDRPLTRKKDLVNNVGSRVKIVAKTLINGQRNFTGILESVTDKALILKMPDIDNPVEISIANISDAQISVLGDPPAFKTHGKSKKYKRHRRK